MKPPAPVVFRREPITIPTYPIPSPDKNPMFLEKRVYQGSRGKVYPLPFYDRVAEEKVPQAWDAVHLENEFIRLMILPQLGGRIHIGQDKTNGYDFFYQQHVIKPALVGLAGPWISGGVEFNWPQHHRPATFMPVDIRVEEHADGSKTVWCSDHDPMCRMKGMHGICLHPGKAYLELKVRLYNRTPLVQTFLWWANVATRVHDRYQSFFPPDVTCVADHAKRAMSTFPICRKSYYGVDYRPGTDLRWYKNIPVPTSYMCLGTQEDFFGGYDHQAGAGLVHIANHHISPGKKQWTWGNHEFGHAWDRNLTDADGPYIELMAGVYTDNQPDFSFLAPGETKTFSQFWYPIQKIGPAHHANLNAALHLTSTKVGVSVSAPFADATVRLTSKGRTVLERKVDLAPGSPFVHEGHDFPTTALKLTVLAADGHEIISYAPRTTRKKGVPPPATEPPLPSEIVSNDELYITGLHLEQYRHATRQPELYWREALRRDPRDARCHNAMGLWHLRRGEFQPAEQHFRHAIERLTRRNPNPYDSEPYYNLGLTLRHQADAMRETRSSSAPHKQTANEGACQKLLDGAYAAFYKATWSYAWQSAGYHALAEIDCRRKAWSKALDHLNRSLRVNTDHLRARNLKAVVLQKLGCNAEADHLLRETLALDPLDWWTRHLLGEAVGCDTQTRLDLALDLARAGLDDEAIQLLEQATPEAGSGAAPMVAYSLNWLRGKPDEVEAAPDYCFPSRLEEIAILEAAPVNDSKAPYYLGNLLYDRRRYEDAIRCWEKSARRDPSFSIVWRNLGIAYFNIRRQPLKARAAYERALRANPHDARLLYERDQLWKRLGEAPHKRLLALEQHPSLVKSRDDLSVELSALYNQTGQPEKALEIVRTRKFQPWEGGEGLALGQHVRTHLALGRRALAAGQAAQALEYFTTALTSPHNLGEARHLLANQSDVWHWLGVACAALGDKTSARSWWKRAATFRGDFQEMSVRRFSEMTYDSALALSRLGRKAQAQALLRELLTYAKQLVRTEARIDYFATSLPTMLLFEEDLQKRQQTTATFLMAQAQAGLGRTTEARRLLRRVLRMDASHAPAADLLGEMTSHGMS